jgi:hypothetical protein
MLRHGRAERPLPSLITAAPPGAEGNDLDLSEFPEEGASEFPEQLKD